MVGPALSRESSPELSPAQVFASCQRFLSGHPRRSPRQTLEHLAETLGEEEGWDHYGEGKLIRDFEQRVAELLGKEAAVFVPSGTMAQQIALRIWCDRKDRHSVAFHPTCHLEIHEQKGYQRLHGLHAVLVGSPGSLITREDLEQVREPVGAVLFELPQREIGGQLPGWDDLSRQIAWARERDAAVHLDGARLWECRAFYDRSYAAIAAPFDSVYVSFYKGLGGMAGAVLSGSSWLIEEARVWIRRHGGNLIRLLPYVVSARDVLGERLERFPRYQEEALRVARVLTKLPGVKVKPDPPQACMMHVYLPGEPKSLIEGSLQVAKEHHVQLFTWTVESEVPGYSKTELSIGECAEEISDEELRTYFEQALAV